MTRFRQIWNPGCYSSLTNPHRDWHKKQFQCPHGLELLLSLHPATFKAVTFQCPHGLELLLSLHPATFKAVTFQCPLGLELLLKIIVNGGDIVRFNALSGLSCYASFLDLAFKPAKFQCPLGLELLHFDYFIVICHRSVSMPSRA